MKSHKSIIIETLKAIQGDRPYVPATELHKAFLEKAKIPLRSRGGGYPAGLHWDREFCDLRFATSIKVEALAQLGRMLKDMPKNQGVRANGRDIGGTKMEPPSSIPTLAEIGLDKKTSKLAQISLKGEMVTILVTTNPKKEQF